MSRSPVVGGLPTGSGSVRVQGRVIRGQAGPQLVPQILKGPHQLCNPPHGPLVLVLQHVNVDAARRTFQFQASRHEIVHVDQTGPVDVQELEKAPCLISCQVHRGKVVPQSGVLQAVFKIREVDGAGAAAVHAPEDRLQLADVLLLHGQVRLHDHVLVLLGRLDRALAHDACDHVQDRYLAERYEAHEEQRPHVAHSVQRLRVDMPVHSTGEGLEERLDGIWQGSKMIVQLPWIKFWLAEDF
mmetsp:Transcript_20789/g.56768  ORF Transcript_20789/g.56768 Transcript_20789/m.56768 type:complete len:242 (+) Transcript_20789:84-809(+)